MASIFEKISQATNVALEAYIQRGKDTIEKSRRDLEENKKFIEPKAFSFEEQTDADDIGYRQRPSAITFEVLRQMSLRNVVIAAIIQTLVSYVKQHSKPQADKYSPGFKFIMRDNEAIPSDEDKSNISQLEHWLLNTGFTENRKPERQLSFNEFLTMITRDVLTYDQVAIETVAAQDGSLAYFLPVDSGSVYFATRQTLNDESLVTVLNENINAVNEEDRERVEQIKQRDSEKIKDEDYKYVQIFEGQIKRGFFEEELVFKMMNPVNDLNTHGYSIGPLEYLANIVSYHLYAEAHNRLFFVQGFASRGILHLEGEIPREQVDAFRRQWREQLSGTTNAWRTPIMAGGNKINWVPLHVSNKDMEWTSWIEYLIKLMCALYGISPTEINFDIAKTHGHSSLGETGAKMNQVLKNSHNRGLKPLLSFLEDVINEKIIKRFNEEYYLKYKFTFCGLDAESKMEELERQEKEGKVWKTFDEIRAEHDYPKLKEGGHIVGNSEYLQWYLSFSKEAKEKQQMIQDSQEKMAQQKIGMGENKTDNKLGKQNPSDNTSKNSSKKKINKPDEISKSYEKDNDNNELEKSFSNDPQLLRVEIYKI